MIRGCVKKVSGLFFPNGKTNLTPFWSFEAALTFVLALQFFGQEGQRDQSECAQSDVNQPVPTKINDPKAYEQCQSGSSQQDRTRVVAVPAMTSPRINCTAQPHPGKTGRQNHCRPFDRWPNEIHRQHDDDWTTPKKPEWEGPGREIAVRLSVTHLLVAEAQQHWSPA